MNLRADQLHHLARSYVLDGLGKGDFDVIPYSEVVTLRAPLCPGGSGVPLTGRTNLREQWWAPLPQLIASVSEPESEIDLHTAAMNTLGSAQTATQPQLVRAFIQEYLDAGQGTDEDRILNHYSTDVVLELPTGRLVANLRYDQSPSRWRTMRR